MANAGLFDCSSIAWCGHSRPTILPRSISISTPSTLSRRTIRHALYLLHWYTDGGSALLATNNAVVRTYVNQQTKVLFVLPILSVRILAGGYHPVPTTPVPGVSWCTNNPADCAGLLDDGENPDWCARTHPLQCKLKAAFLVDDGTPGRLGWRRRKSGHADGYPATDTNLHRDQHTSELHRFRVFAAHPDVWRAVANLESSPANTEPEAYPQIVQIAPLSRKISAICGYAYCTNCENFACLCVLRVFVASCRMLPQ